jgi:hypothetical protein
MKSLLSIFFGLFFLNGLLTADGVKPPLNNAEDALAFFKESAIPRLEKAGLGPDHDPVKAIRRMVWTIRCWRVRPEDIDKSPDIHGVRWPEKHYPILSGSVEQVKASKAHKWIIHYSTGIGNSLYAYLDAATGKILLAYIIPEG